MFDMGQIGLRISALRRAKNMTQLELADRMGISFQAVSNWERGQSMPDISKLPELAEVLGVSIDALLGRESPLIQSAAAGTIREYVAEQEVTMEELRDAAPLLKPEQVDVVFEVIDEEAFDEPGEIEELLPFISRELIQNLARGAAAAGRYGEVERMAPFVDRAVLGEIALQMVECGRSPGGIAPFLDARLMDRLARRLYERKGVAGLDELAPFMSKVTLAELAREAYARDGLRRFEHIAPFLSRELLNELARDALQKDGLKAISPLAPFLDREMIEAHVRQRYLK